MNGQIAGAYFADSLGRLRKNRVALVSGFFIAFLCLTAGLAPWITPYPFAEQDMSQMLAPPGSSHWLGTDELGRDLLSRLIYGARVSMIIALATSFIALLVGTAYGALSGYLGGFWDNLMMRFVEMVYSFPDLLLIILITVMIGRGLEGILLALSLVSWVSVARLIRGEVLRLRELTFVEAARASGAGTGRILLRHILPNTIGPLLVTLTFRIPAVILAESTLSFIGLGIQPPYSSWGTLANDGWTALRFHPHLIISPGLAIFFTILAFNFFGDGLRDAFDPRMAGSGE